MEQTRTEKAKILIVDDEKINIDVLIGLLKPHYHIVVAKDGEQALRRLEKRPLPDLVLLDVMMPGMDGYEVCRAIKANVVTQAIPVIFVTAKNDERDEARGFEAGAVDYIPKPFSPLIAMARVKTHIELKRRGDMLEKLAVMDGLTGIANRRRFDEFLDYEWERSVRYGHDFSLILMDIDFFKFYNDTYGHAEGDDCLKRVATAVADAMPRTVDLAARYGGEEFACILPETDEEGARVVADRILDNVRTLMIPHEKSQAADHVTLSLGIATAKAPISEERTLDLVELADTALYSAKQSGRNRIAVHNKSSAQAVHNKSSAQGSA
ncbi:MAG: diguanylate cyclase [Magnetococcales bacterium]|nr:diguanylate cyclase [Magnetococcales bacterium]